MSAEHFSQKFKNTVEERVDTSYVNMAENSGVEKPAPTIEDSLESNEAEVTEAAPAAAEAHVEVPLEKTAEEEAQVAAVRERLAKNAVEEAPVPAVETAPETAIEKEAQAIEAKKLFESMGIPNKGNEKKRPYDITKESLQKSGESLQEMTERAFREEPLATDERAKFRFNVGMGSSAVLMTGALGSLFIGGPAGFAVGAGAGALIGLSTLSGVGLVGAVAAYAGTKMYGRYKHRKNGKRFKKLYGYTP